MLIEVKVKVAWIIDTKVQRKLETYVLDKEVFAEAEYEVMSLLNDYKTEGTVEDYEIQSLKISSIKEIMTQFGGECSFIASLKDVLLQLQDDGSEKTIKYKVLLWADNISDAMAHVREIASQGYDMQIDSLKEVNYTYLISQNNGRGDTVSENQVTEDA